MAFCFKRKEPLSKAIPRLGCERVEDAIECLKDCARGEAIHCARKDIKKVRAVLRLVRCDIKRKEFRLVTQLLKKAAKRLAGPRDAFVGVITIRGLTSHFKGQLAEGALRHIRVEFRKALKAEMKRFTKGKSAVARELRQALKAVERIHVTEKGWKALGPGLESSYDTVRCAYQIALKDSSAENLHEWRKRAKDLWYQVTLLRRIWREQIDATAAELELLGEHLGDYHDLVMLGQAADQKCNGKRHPKEAETLNGLIQERQRELRTAALALGGRFFAEKPSAFCNRLAQYWKIWCNEKSPHNSVKLATGERPRLRNRKNRFKCIEV